MIKTVSPSGRFILYERNWVVGTWQALDRTTVGCCDFSFACLFLYSAFLALWVVYKITLKARSIGIRDTLQKQAYFKRNLTRS